MKKKTLSIFLALIMVLSVIPVISVSAAEVTKTGSCGENVNYNLDDDGNLIISGTGYMTNNFFENNTAIKAVTIENGVTSIGNSVFKNCAALKSISIPASVKTIGESAFNGCSKLETVTIPEVSKLTYIGDFAFYNCAALKSISIPASVTTIGNSAFDSCSKLETVTIPENSELTTIGYFAFDGCGALTSISIPESVTAIGQSAFDECSKLETVTIPENSELTSIGFSAFYNCSALTSVSIPASVTSIDNYAFYGCNNLKHTVILNPQCAINDSGTTIASGSDIYGFEGSNAQTYAKKYGRTFIAIEDGIHCPEFIEGYPATCTEDGRKDCYRCLVTGKLFSDEACTNELTEADLVIKAAHKWDEGVVTKEPTCTADGERTYTCTVCQATKTEEIPALGHTMVKVNEVKPTCTTAGNKEYYHCSVCGKDFKDAEGKTETTTEAEVIDALGHTMEKTDAVKPTCTTGGNNEYYYCTVCEKYFKDAEGNTETTVAAEIIDALGHKMEKTDAVKPTCTKGGNNEYYYCPICDKYFKDAEGNTETTVEAETLDALGHKMEKINAAEPTCTETGNKEYYHCPVCDKYFKDAEGKTETTVEAETLDVLGHKMEKIDAVTPTCTTSGHNAYYHCTVCGKYFKDTEGKTETTANEEILAAPGHKWDEGKITKTPTCTEDGIKTYTCTACGKTKTEVVKATGHVDADGDGKCDNCGESLSGGNTWFDKLESFFNLIIAILNAVAEFLAAIGI